MTKMTRGTIIALAFAFSFQITSCQYPIDPLPWNPPLKPVLEGPYAPNDLLVDAELIGNRLLNGPEDVAIDEQGRLYCGSVDGVIHRFWPDGPVELFARTGGHPLGLDFDPGGNLIVCEPFQGLLSVDPNGKVTLLVDQADSLPLGLVDDVDVASDGTIYFSDASSKFGPYEDYLDMLEARPHGRLLAFNPYTQETRVLLENLYFANGVALSQNEDFVLVNETFRYRITRYWLQGPKSGTAEIFVDNLPGMPDGISANGSGTFWIAFYSVRSDLLDAIHPFPELKLFASLMSYSDFHALGQPYGFILSMDEDRTPLVSYQDSEGQHLSEITSVEEHEGRLYIGSLYGDAIGRMDLF